MSARSHAIAMPPTYIWCRLEPDTDPVLGIANVVSELGLDAGSIVECIGSLRTFTFVLAQPEKDGGWRFSEPIIRRGPMELVSAQGTWARDAGTGEIVVHLHGLAVESTGSVHGGHFVSGESRILVTCEVGLLTGVGLKMSRRFDPAAAFSVIMPNS